MLCSEKTSCRFAAAALLFLFVFISGCTVKTESGEPERADFAEFVYTDNGAENTFEAVQADNASYHFLDSAGNCVYDSSHIEISEPDEDGLIKVKVYDVPKTAVKSVTAYYGSSGRLVGIGADVLDWNGSSASVSTPNFVNLNLSASLTLKASCREADLNSEIRFSALLEAGGLKEPLDVTHLAVFSNVDNEILEPIKDKNDSSVLEFTNGFYKCIKEGTVADLRASLETEEGTLEGLLNGAVYIKNITHKLKFLYDIESAVNSFPAFKENAYVRYNFLNEAGRTVYYTDFLALRAASGSGTAAVMVDHIPDYAVNVCAAYYNSSREMIAVGANNIVWEKEKDYKRPCISPKINIIDALEVDYTINASSYFLHLDEDVYVKVGIYPYKTSENIDITPFVTFVKFTSSVLKPEKYKLEKTSASVTPGYYKASAAGFIKGYATSVSKVKGMKVIKLGSKIAVEKDINRSLCFTYSCLSDNKDIYDRIYFARYSFTDHQGSCVFVSDKIVIDFSRDLQESVKIDDIPGSAACVNAVYYGQDGNEIIAAGKNDIDWNEDGLASKAVIAELADVKGIVKVSDYVIHPDDRLTIEAYLVPKDGSLPLVNVTPFVSLTGFSYESGDEILSPLKIGNEFKNKFIGAKYGIEDKVTAEFDESLCVKVPSIYVTDQTVENLAIMPADIDGTDVYSFKDHENNCKSYVLFVENKKASDGSIVINRVLGQKYAYINCGNHTECAAVNVQPYKACAEYTDEAGRGPSPKDADISNYVSFSCETIGNVHASMQKNVLTVESFDKNNKLGEIYVHGSYMGCSGTASVRCIFADSQIALWNDGCESIGGNIFIPNLGNEEAVILKLKGFFTIRDGKILYSVPFDLPSSLVPGDHYPLMMSNNEEDPNLTIGQKQDDKQKYCIYIKPGAKEQEFDVWADLYSWMPDMVKAHYVLKDKNGVFDRDFDN